MDYKITIEHIKILHTNAVSIEDKIIHLSSMLEYLHITKKIQSIENYENHKQDFKDLKVLRDNLSHLIKNSLTLEIWNDRFEIHDRVYNAIKNII